MRRKRLRGCWNRFHRAPEGEVTGTGRPPSQAPAGASLTWLGSDAGMCLPRTNSWLCQLDTASGHTEHWSQGCGQVYLNHMDTEGSQRILKENGVVLPEEERRNTAYEKPQGSTSELFPLRWPGKIMFQSEGIKSLQLQSLALSEYNIEKHICGKKLHRI